MKFETTPLDGVLIVELEQIGDERGFFARAFCAREFEAHGLINHFVQANISANRTAGTLRGMHWQDERAPEAKFIRCIRGAIHDVVVDRRVDSPSFGQHFSVELSAKNHRALYIPPLFAHGFQTLEDDTEVLYLVSGFYTPEAECGLRHDDPSLRIDWPRTVSEISEKDRCWELISQRPRTS